MNTTNLNRDERGENGIGTMLIFIALVLTASMAAGLLIQTANSVQQQAQATGTAALVEVSTGLEVSSVIGDRVATIGTNGTYSDTIQSLEIMVGMLAGSPDVAIENVIVQVSDGDTVVTLVYNADSANAALGAHEWDATYNAGQSAELKVNADANSYTVEELLDIDDSFYEATETSNPDLIVTGGDLLRVYVNASAAGLTLGPQTDGWIKVYTQFGHESLEAFSTPEAFTGRYVEL